MDEANKGTKWSSAYLQDIGLSEERDQKIFTTGVQLLMLPIWGIKEAFRGDSVLRVPNLG